MAETFGQWEQLEQAFIQIRGAGGAISQEQLAAADGFITSVKMHPEGIIIFLTFIGQTGNEVARHSAVTVLYNLVKTVWPSLPPPVQEHAKQLFIAILQMGTLSAPEVSLVADSCEIIFASLIREGIFWNELMRIIGMAYGSQNFNVMALLLSRIFPAMPDNIIQESWPAFKNMAYSGLATQDVDTCFNSMKVLFKIVKALDSEEATVAILEPLVGFFEATIPQSLTLSQHQFDILWAYLAKLIEYKGISPDKIIAFWTFAMGFITTADDSLMDQKLVMLDSFLPFVGSAPLEVVEVFVSCSIVLAAGAVNRDEILPDSWLSMPEKALVTLPQKVICPLIQQKLSDELKGSPGQVVVGITLIGLLLQYGQGCLRGSAEFVQGALTTGLGSGVPVIQMASLKAAEILADNEWTEVSVGLLRPALALVASPVDDVRGTAYNTVMSLCESCDTEVEGLFDTVWGFQAQGAIGPTNLENYVLLVAELTRLSNDINDEKLGMITGFLGQVFDASRDITVKSAGLILVSALFAKRESLIGGLMGTVVPILNECLQASNDDTLCQALRFIQNLLETFGTDVVSFIGPNYCEGIAGIITQSESNTRVFTAALNAAVKMIRYCDHDPLIRVVVTACEALIQGPDVDPIIDGCETLAQCAKVLATPQRLPVAVSFFDTLCELIESETDVDILNAGFEALANLLKKCRALAPPEFDGRAADIIIKFIQGGALYVENGTEFLIDSPPDFIRFFMNFIAIYVRHADNIAEICVFLLQWLSKADEDVAVSITNVFVDAVIHNTDKVDVAPLLQYIAASAGGTTSIDLKQNIAVLLSTMIQKERVEVATIATIVPLLSAWWQHGSSESVGHQECLANIAILYLRIYFAGGTVDPEILVQCVSAYPPADFKESENMSTLLLQIFSREQPPVMYQALVLAVANLLTEPKPTTAKRKMSDTTRANIIGLFQTVIGGNDGVKQGLLTKFAENAQRLQEIQQYL